MHFLKIILLSILIFSLASCSSPKKVVALQKPSINLIPKIETLTLYESLKKIDAKVGDPIFIRIFKKEKKLEIWVKPKKKFKLYKTYSICTFSGDLGPKLKQGDNQSPEGFYTISQKQLKPNSKYHLGLILDFPNKYDRYQKRTGAYLMIHGKCSSTGCYAMGNTQIEEIYKIAEEALKNSQKKFNVHIFPFEMTPKNMELYSSNRWLSFWINLKLGYDIFERYGVVPIVRADKNNYRFFVLPKDKI